MSESTVMTLNAAHTLGLSIFASYFLFIFFLLYIIIISIQRNAKPRAKLPAVVFGGLSIASLIHTWFWMFGYMAWSFQKYETALEGRDTQLVIRIASWLRDTALFEQAWSVVCTGAFNWWWSEQLCLFTASGFTVFLFLHRERVPHAWAYMLLGQVVAISVAFSLFNLALVLIPSLAHKQRNVLLPPSLTIPVMLSMFSISLSPYTNATTFLPNLLAMHAFLVLPLLPFPDVTPRSISPRATSFYTLLALLSLILRARTTLAALSALHITSSPFFSLSYPADVAMSLWTAPTKIYTRAWEVLHLHPAQSSIGWDVVWTGVIWLAWGAVAPEGPLWRGGTIATHGLQGIFTSAGVVAPLEFGRVLREDVKKLE